MSSSVMTQHGKLVNSVAERYQRAGYEVIIEPGPLAIPFELNGYSPDLIAKKGDSTLIVEVKTEAAKVSFDQLRSIVDEVRRHQGWHFVLVTAQDVLAIASPDETEDLGFGDVSRQLGDARKLSDLGEHEAAYLKLWIAFERMMRSQARRVGLPVDRLAPSILIRQLYSQGELSMSQFDDALSCQTVRNRIVHGFQAADLNEAVTRLNSVVREVLAQWSDPSTEHDADPGGG